MRYAPMLAAFAVLAVALPASAGGEIIVVEPGACDYVTAHEPAPDVAYRPGVDAEGNLVAPADLDDSGRIELPEEYTTDIFVHLEDAIDIPAGSNLERIKDSEIAIGTLTIRDEELLFDGRPLTSQEQNAIAAECRRLQEEAADK